MRREVSLEEISNGKLYTSSSMVRLACDGCKGKAECCRNTSDTILLDPYDIWQLSRVLHLNGQQMMGKYLLLRVVDGVVLPNLLVTEETGCVFLNEAGQCSIHDARPGFCRLFPLGRIYNEAGTSFSYFVQEGECPCDTGAKVKIEKWLGTPKMKMYEKYILYWHSLLKKVEALGAANVSAAAGMNTRFLSEMFFRPYGEDFYTEFYERAEAILQELADMAE